LLSQVVDLERMRQDGTLDNPYRYFGIGAPATHQRMANPRSWFNFDPLTYLECAARGMFDGWTPEANPNVIALEQGNNVKGLFFGLEPAQEGEYALPRVSWDEVADFLIYGQIYE